MKVPLWSFVAASALLASSIASSASPSSSPSSLSPDAAAQVLNSAIDAASAGNMARALPLFEKAAALAPTNPDVLFNVAYAFTQARRLEDALDLLTRLLRVRPNNREAHIKAAQVCRDLGRPSEVVTHLRAALALDPRNPNAYAYLGETLNNLKRWDEAVATYSDGLKLIDPSFAVVSPTKGPAAVAAAVGLQPASAMHPQQVVMAASTHRSRADALLNLRRPSEAMKHLGRALDLQPDDGEALASLWYARLDLNDWACGTKPTIELTTGPAGSLDGSAASPSSLSSWTSPSSLSSPKEAAAATAPPPLVQWCIDDLGRRAADVAAMGLLQADGGGLQQQQQQQPGQPPRPSTLSPYRTLFLPPPYFSSSSLISLAAGGGSSGGGGGSSMLSLVASWAKRLAADELGAASPQQQQQQQQRVQWGSRQERLKRGGSIGGSGTSGGAVVRVGFVSRRFERYPGTQLMLGLFHHFGHAPTNQISNSTKQQQPSSSVEFFAYAHGPDDGSSERKAVAAAAATAARNATARRRVEAVEAVEAEEAHGGAGDDAKNKKKRKKRKKKRRRLSNGRFIDVSALAPSVAAAAVEEDDIDVLFDYDGLHDFNSVALLAHRPAAVAATWLGFAQSPGMGCRKISTTTAGDADGSAGACVVDYLVADRIVVDPAEAAGGGASRFSESMLLLPHSYQPQDELQNDVAAQLGLAPRTRLQLHRSRQYEDNHDEEGSEDGIKEEDEDDEQTEQEKGPVESKDAVFGRIRAERKRFGLPGLGEGIVLGALVRSAKITPTVFDDFMDILRRTTPQRTVLWLQVGKSDRSDYTHDAATEGRENNVTNNDNTGNEEEEDEEDYGDGGRRRRLRNEAAARGVDPSRLRFAGGRAPRFSYFQRLAAIDLFLDTRPYGAHTVSADALWAGCPVLTLPGLAFASRVGSSLYAAATDAEAASRKEDAAATAAPAMPLGAAESAAAVLVARSSMEFVDTAVRLCGAEEDSTPLLSLPSSPPISSSLEVLRGHVSRGIAPSLSHMWAVASGSGKGGERARSRAVGLFDSEGFADSLARAAAAMTEVQVQGAHAAALGATKKPLPHLYFAH